MGWTPWLYRLVLLCPRCCDYWVSGALAGHFIQRIALGWWQSPGLKSRVLTPRHGPKQIADKSSVSPLIQGRNLSTVCFILQSPPNPTPALLIRPRLSFLIPHPCSPFPSPFSLLPPASSLVSLKSTPSLTPGTQIPISALLLRSETGLNKSRIFLLYSYFQRTFCLWNKEQRPWVAASIVAVTEGLDAAMSL